MSKKKKAKIEDMKLTMPKITEVETQETIDKQVQKDFGATIDEIAFQLPHTLTIKDIDFEIKRKGMREQFRLSRQLVKIVSSIKGIDIDKVQVMFQKDNFNMKDLGILIAGNYDEINNKYYEIIEFFIDNFLEEKDKEIWEDKFHQEDLEPVMNDMLRIILPFVLGPVKMILRALSSK